MPEILAVVPLPTVEERRRRETMLARVMLVAIELVLSGEGLGLETALDLVVRFGTATLSYRHTGMTCEREAIACIGSEWMLSAYRPVTRSRHQSFDRSWSRRKDRLRLNAFAVAGTMGRTRFSLFRESCNNVRVTIRASVLESRGGAEEGIPLPRLIRWDLPLIAFYTVYAVHHFSSNCGSLHFFASASQAKGDSGNKHDFELDGPVETTIS